MNPESLARSLAQHPFCKDLTQGQNEFLAGCAKNARYEAGEYLVREGSLAESLFLVRAGSVAIESHIPGKGAVKVDTLAPGDILGWSVLLPPFRWHLDARALEPTLVFALDANCLRGKVQADHGFGYAFTLRLLAAASERLTHARLQQLDVYKAELG
ncbi:MAG: cyclic nucleotide-binding domain-containing protein [Polyangiaceae bacterium]|nr:cyclic nucleotide-binding domain-containing protein [Myxococcales bacterium]MCC6900156.1 cyclic nucleotide-binding domain-containing protein [Polyangiaceae bacterium]